VCGAQQKGGVKKKESPRAQKKVELVARAVKTLAVLRHRNQERGGKGKFSDLNDEGQGVRKLNRKFREGKSAGCDEAKKKKSSPRTEGGEREGKTQPRHARNLVPAGKGKKKKKRGPPRGKGVYIVKAKK